MLRLLPSLAAALACGAFPACAAAAETSATSTGADPIVITSDRLAYGVKATGTATKIPTDIKDIPQALTIISGAQISTTTLG